MGTFQILELEPSVVDKYRATVPSLCRILRSLLQPGISPEHDIGGITNPFLQVGAEGEGGWLLRESVFTG